MVTARSASSASSTVTRTGILGGTFNPPHNGHIALARAARDQLALDRVLLVPARVPPHKPVDDEPGAAVRYGLCEEASLGEDRIEASRIELDREPPSWMVDTLAGLLDADPTAELTLILGEDAILSLPTWREPDRIARLANLAWTARPPANLESVGEAVRHLSAALGAGRKPTRLKMDPLDISSTEVRRRVASGEPIDDLVPPAVADRIAALGIYAAKVAS